MKRVSHLRSVFIERFARIVSVSFSYHFRIISVSFSYRFRIVLLSRSGNDTGWKGKRTNEVRWNNWAHPINQGGVSDVNPQA